MSNSEQTLSIIKPDAVERNLEGNIVDIFTKSGLKIIKKKKNYAMFRNNKWIKQKDITHINKKENYFLEHGNLDLGIRYARAINALIKLSKNCSFLMKPGTMHMRMANTDCKIVEISTKDFDNDLVKCLQNVQARLLIASFNSDWLFPKEYGLEIQMSAIKAGIDSAYIELEGDYGHDSFLFYSDQYADALKNFLNSNVQLGS